jgi:hypothetical protein
MRIPIIVLAATAALLGSTASADPYKDFTAQGYRWVAVDGPYACPSKADLQEITRHRTDLLEVKMVSDLRAYYLIRGVIVQVVQEDAASGMSEVHLPGGSRPSGPLRDFLAEVPSKILSEWWKRPQHQVWCFKGKRCPAQPQKPMLMLLTSNM